MVDSFLAEVISYNPLTKKAKINPLVILQDGTQKTIILDSKPVAGITPSTKDLVLVLAIRNNLDDEKISIYYKPTWSNCRIIHVVKPFLGIYKFTGNYQFVGGVTFTGDLTVTENLTVQKNLIVAENTTVTKSLTVGEDVSAGGDLTLGGDATIVGDATIGGVSFTTFYNQVKAHAHNIITPLPGSPVSPSVPPIT